MKETLKYFCLYLVAAILFSCRPHQYPHILVEADSLCEANPDSAVSLLRHLRPQFSSGSEADRMYYQLLCIKAADKNFIPHESDSTILSLVDYYKTKGDKKRLTEAYFYAGSVYRDLNDAPEQMKYMQLSLETMPDDYPIHKRMLTHYQIGRLFILQDLDEEAITSFREAIRLCKLTDDTVRLVHFLRDAAFAWEGLDMSDSAMVYYKEAYHLSLQKKDRVLQDGLNIQMAACYDAMGDSRDALERMKLVNFMDDTVNISSSYSIASRIFEHNGMKDSAVVCYRVLLSKGNLLARCLANQKLAGFALKSKDFEKAYQYLLVFNSLSDSISKLNAAEAVEKMHSLYNYQLREKENMALSISNKNKTISIVIIILVSVILMGVLSVLWINKKRQMEVGLEKLRRLKDEELAKSQEMIDRNKCEIETLRKELGSTDSENVSLKQELKEKEERLMHIVALAEMEKQQRATALKKLEMSDIINVIHRLANDNSTMETSHWQLLEEEVTRYFPDFHNSVYALFTPSNHEYHILLLMKAKLTTVQIASLTARSKQAISSAKARMYQKAFGKKGKAEEWEKIVCDF